MWLVGPENTVYMTNLILRIALLLLIFCQCRWQNEALCRDRNGKARPKIGLVLGGGGAKGAAEVGVLKYIEKAGIDIDYIAGTSIGSIIGGLYACGYRSEQLDSMFREQDWLTLLSDRNEAVKHRMVSKRDGVTYFFGFPVGRRGSKLADKSVGLVRGDHVVALLDSMLARPDSISFDSLPIPFRCVATDYRERRRVVLSSGILSRCIRASMAIPGVFKAVDIDGTELLDGGLTDNLPVDVVKEMGADIVIAIDLTQNKHEKEDSERRQKRKFMKNAKTNMGRLMRWVVQRPDVARYKENLKMVDIYINPKLKGYGAGSFTPKKLAKMITLGEKAGEKAYKKLKKLRRQMQ